MTQNKIVKAKNFLKISGILAAARILALPGAIMAQEDTVPYREIPKELNINTMLGKISGYFFGVVIASCVFMVLWGAFDIATGGDSEDKVLKGRKKILYAMIGLVIAAMSGAIISLVQNVAGVK